MVAQPALLVSAKGNCSGSQYALGNDCAYRLNEWAEHYVGLFFILLHDNCQLTGLPLFSTFALGWWNDCLPVHRVLYHQVQNFQLMSIAIDFCQFLIEGLFWTSSALTCIGLYAVCTGNARSHKKRAY